MNFETLQSAGLAFRSFVLSFSDLLREEWTPGAVSVALLVFAVIFGLLLIARDFQRYRALKWASKTISVASDRKSFVAQFHNINRAFLEARDAARGGFPIVSIQKQKRTIGVAWGEYAETMVMPESENDGVIRNGIRPGVFFDAEDLEFEPGWWRVLPGIFVSVGLLLTFLGLIAALTAIGAKDIDDNSLRELLNAASAKFIMSLTGLACSIALTIVGRLSTQSVDRRLREFGHALEKRLRFQSLEEIASEQIEIQREQGVAMRQVATEMVAELARPLKEDLPNAIGESIRVQMEPLVKNLQSTSEEGLGQMVGDLSQRLADDVGTSLQHASSQLGTAADRMAQLAGSMESGTGRMGSQYEAIAQRMNEQLLAMQKAMREEVDNSHKSMAAGTERLVERMAEALEEIRTNTSENSRAMADAASDMRSAAEAFKTEVADAAEQGAEVAKAEMQKAANAAGESISAATTVLTGPMETLAQRLEAAAEATRQGVDGLARVADAARSGGDAINRGSERFEVAAGAMLDASEPIRLGIEGLKGTTQNLANGMQSALQASEQNSRDLAQRTRDALDAASNILGAQHQGIASAMEGLALAVRELKGQGDRLDDIDAKLGAAFERYRTQVEATMTGTAEQVEKIVKILTPALDTMHAVVQQAEEFAPQSQRRNNGAPA